MSEPYVLTGFDRSLKQFAQQLVCLCKLRIGMVMMLTALVAMVVTPGPALSVTQILVLAFAVLASAASAGAFNQYYEVDLDSCMTRTRNRPFVTGQFEKNISWLLFIVVLLIAGVGSAALVLNIATAVYIFLGAFFYGVVYTVWLKRRTAWNIVIGGASGSFAVLGGAAAVNPELGPVAVLFALTLFLWTPSHFWCLAIAKRQEYAQAGVPMLPVVIGDQRTAFVTMLNTLALVLVSVLPFFYGMGLIYLVAAASGGAYFIYRNALMLQQPSRQRAMHCFFASLLQLVFLLAGAVLDVYLPGL